MLEKLRKAPQGKPLNDQSLDCSTQLVDKSVGQRTAYPAQIQDRIRNHLESRDKALSQLNSARNKLNLPPAGTSVAVASIDRELGQRLATPGGTKPLPD